MFPEKGQYPENFFCPIFDLTNKTVTCIIRSMRYEPIAPIVVGLFTLTTAILIVYFFWLFTVLRNHPSRSFIVFATFSVMVMVIGLLLTGLEL